MEFCKNFKYRQVYRLVYKLQTAFVIRLPLWLLGYGTNKEFKLRLTDFSGMLLDNKLKPLSIVGVA